MKGIESRAITKICPLLEDEPPMEETPEKTNTKKSKKEKKKADPQDTYWNKRNLRPRPLRSMLWLAIMSLWFTLAIGFGNVIHEQSSTNITEFKKSSWDLF